MIRIPLFAFATILVLAAPALTASAGEVGEACDGCHGHDGVSTRQDVPTIAGISVPVQLDALKAFAAKTRPCRKVAAPHGGTEDMCTLAAGLSAAQIAALADHYSKLPYARMKQPVAAAAAANGKSLAARECQICHSSGGTDPTDDAGLLGGQPLGWLKRAIADMKDGKSPQPKMMQAKTSKLSDADVTALAEYYASL
ncbi:MAG TPA: c-type cytochrome [Steroidobacteraceae bacterium]|nr:c-type cytochrome [Steroidobacteraceae bacterium]